MRLWLGIAVVAAVLVLAGGEAAHADGRAWRALSRDLAAPWPRIQRPDGSLPDALRGGNSARYGNGIAGLGLLQTGVRSGDRRMIRAGLRAVGVQTRRLRDPAGAQEFRTWAVAEAYSLVRSRLGHWPSARRAARRWAGFLRHAKIFQLRRRAYENKALVDAVGFLELARTGLRSRVKGAALGSGRRQAWRLVLRLINRRVPRMVHRRGSVLSDPVANPPAYHALSYAMYARAVRLLGPRASRRAHAVLRRLAWSTARMTAPNGDAAYWGRSQAMSWTLSSAAYGLAVTARQRGLSRGARRRYRAVADRLLGRLRAYGSGPRGQWIVPALRQDRSALAAVDHYAHAPEYTGLALVYLNWAIPALPRRSTAGPIPADRPMRAVIGQGRGRFAVIRHGGLWYAVRERGSGNLRYDFGVVAFQRLEGGGWRPVMPLRPPATGSGGPVLRRGRAHGHPAGTTIRVARGGRVLIRGGFRHRGRWLRRGVRFEVTPGACGPQLRVRARPGDRYSFTALFRSGEPPNVTFSAPVAASRFGGSRPSPSDAHLRRARFSVRASRRGPLAVTYC